MAAADVVITGTVLTVDDARPTAEALAIADGRIIAVGDRSDIEALIGPVLIAGETGEGAHASPGMHLRHYRPSTPLILGDPPAAGKGAHLRIGKEMPSDPLQYAAALYEMLHRLDTQGLDWIAVDPPPDTPEWAGVRDRLRRAAQG